MSEHPNIIQRKKCANIIQRSDADHSRIIGKDAVKLLGEYIPPGFGTPSCYCELLNNEEIFWKLYFTWHHCLRVKASRDPSWL